MKADSSDREIQQKLELERIEDYLSKTTSGYGGLAFSLLVTSQLIAPYTTFKAISFWILASIICYIPKVLISLRFFKAKKAKQVNIDNAKQWERWNYLYSFPAFFAFSSIAFIPFENDVFAGVVIASLALVSLLVGGVLTYRSSKKVISLYLYISLGSIIARCLYEGDYYFYILAIYFSIMIILVKRLINAQYASFIGHLETRLRFEKESLTDSLTGLPNRRNMELFMEKYMRVAHKKREEFQVVMIDIDYFKKYNDTRGHLEGDKLLVSLAHFIEQHIRSSDLFVRYGGEEFAMILPASNSDSAFTFLSSLKNDIERTLGITVSMGVASSSMADNFEHLLGLADAALYQSKQQGRNCVSIANVP